MRNRVAIFFLIASIVPLALVYGLQYLADIQPCLLCLYQRVPFYTAIALSLVSLVIRQRYCRKILSMLCFIAFSTNAALAFYHAGIEYKVFPNVLWCSTQTKLFTSEPKTIEDLGKKLLGDGAQLTIVDCEAPPLRVLGLSLSGINFVYCVVCMIIALALARRDARSIEIK